MSKGAGWSRAHEAVLRLLYPSFRTRQLAALFGRTYKAVKARAKVLKLQKGTRRPWTPADEATLRARYPGEPTQQLARALERPTNQVYAKATKLGLVKTDEYLASPAACRLRRGDQVGKAFRFPKGHVPANKGLRRPGYVRGRMAQTQFKKGHGNEMQPAKARKPIGTERVNADGYLERKVTDKGRGAQRWRAVHILLWEEKNGPMPAEHALVFRDGNKGHVVLENLELISRADLMRRNTYHNRYPKEIGLAIQARGQLTRAINKHSRRAAA